MQEANLDLKSRSEEFRTPTELLEKLQRDLGQRKQQLAELKTKAGLHVSATERAEMLLSGQSDAELADIPARIAKVEADITAHEKAIELQRKRIGDIRGQVSLQICKDVGPEYRAIVAEMKTAATALTTAMEKETRFVQTLLANDVELGHLGRVFLPRVLDRELLQRFIAEA
jgi:uncharacterized membrane-anchored protein YhcB (DUF1043 family)